MDRKFNSFFDLKTITYFLTTLFFIFAGWFGLKERVSIMASDIEHAKNLFSKQEQYFECIKREINSMQQSITRIETLLDERARENQRKTSEYNHDKH